MKEHETGQRMRRRGRMRMSLLCFTADQQLFVVRAILWGTHYGNWLGTSENTNYIMADVLTAIFKYFTK